MHILEFFFSTYLRLCDRSPTMRYGIPDFPSLGLTNRIIGAKRSLMIWTVLYVLYTMVCLVRLLSCRLAGLADFHSWWFTSVHRRARLTSGVLRGASLFLSRSLFILHSIGGRFHIAKVRGFPYRGFAMFDHRLFDPPFSTALPGGLCGAILLLHHPLLISPLPFLGSRLRCLMSTT